MHGRKSLFHPCGPGFCFGKTKLHTSEPLWLALHSFLGSLQKWSWLVVARVFLLVVVVNDDHNDKHDVSFKLKMSLISNQSENPAVLIKNEDYTWISWSNNTLGCVVWAVNDGLNPKVHLVFSFCGVIQFTVGWLWLAKTFSKNLAAFSQNVWCHAQDNYSTGKNRGKNGGKCWDSYYVIVNHITYIQPLWLGCTVVQIKVPEGLQVVPTFD